MFTDEAIESMVLDAFDELCQDQGIEGSWADEGPVGLALAPDAFRLGAAVDLWMRVENREENARQHLVERTTIFGSTQIESVEADEEVTDEDTVDYEPEPLLDELELRGRLLVDVMNVVSQYLSDRRGAIELGEEVVSLEAVRSAMLDAINLSFSDRRLERLWTSGTLIETEDS